MLDKNKTINVTSFNQKGGITANQVFLNTPDRHLTGELKTNLLERVPSDKNRKIKLTSVMGDQEAFSFATEIKDYLNSAGYDVEGVNQAIFDKPMIGQFINDKNDSSMFEIQIGNKPQ